MNSLDKFQKLYLILLWAVSWASMGQCGTVAARFRVARLIKEDEHVL
jgi:hypothetical protein